MEATDHEAQTKYAQGELLHDGCPVACLGASKTAKNKPAIFMLARPRTVRQSLSVRAFSVTDKRVTPAAASRYIITVVQLKLGAAPSTRTGHIAGLAPPPRDPRASTVRAGGDARPKKRR